jgi:hypothetical protein
MLLTGAVGDTRVHWAEPVAFMASVRMTATRRDSLIALRLETDGGGHMAPPGSGKARFYASQSRCAASIP